MRDLGEGGRRPQIWTLVVGAFASASVTCLPSLDPNPPARVGCGDGFIDFDSGEECDPGVLGGIGCTSSCRLSCEGGQVDPVSNHCYLVSDAVRTSAEAIGRCRDLGGHVATFADEEELALVVARLPAESKAYWVALSAEPLSGAYTSFVPDEPGWAPSTQCPGCFAKGGTLDAIAPPGAVAGPCVVGLPGAGGWSKVACDLAAIVPPPMTFCEREPLGRTSRPCEGAVCLQVTATRKVAKRYVFSVTPLTSEESRARCAALGGRLAVFESRREREQIVRELSTVVVSRSFQFWIGLSRSGPSDSWVWEDGAPLGTFHPLPWGDSEPKGQGAARAYVAVAPGAYDTQLARADSPETPRPFLCEVR